MKWWEISLQIKIAKWVAKYSWIWHTKFTIIALVSHFFFLEIKGFFYFKISQNIWYLEIKSSVARLFVEKSLLFLNSIEKI